VPSDDAVLDTVLRSGGVDPSDVHRVTIGFNAVADLAAGKIDAATAFWNAEGVELRQMGIPTREFRVDQFGAPRYPELLLVAKAGTTGAQRGPSLLAALRRGYDVLGRDPQTALSDLLDQVPGLDASAQRAQLNALTSARAFALGHRVATPQLDGDAVARWRAWALRSGLLQGG
jgi:NitT/TauT family transport system substrate-binding protein/putative hydroxymethylpyrimidine transport system substrate-binding protein